MKVQRYFMCENNYDFKTCFDGSEFSASTNAALISLCDFHIFTANASQCNCKRANLGAEFEKDLRFESVHTLLNSIFQEFYGVKFKLVLVLLLFEYSQL